MRERGLRLVQIWIDQGHYDVLSHYAAKAGLSKTEFCRRAVKEACSEIYRAR
jgi:hypothetical protein